MEYLQFRRVAIASRTYGVAAIELLILERLMRTTNSSTASTMPMNTASTTLIAIDSSETNRETARSSAIAPAAVCRA